MSQKDLSKTIPYGDLGIIPLESSKAIGKKVDDYIVGWRTETNVDSSIHFSNYKKNSYIIDAVCPRFGSGEAKGIPLAYEMGRQSGKLYIPARKGIKLYMNDPVVVEDESITTSGKQKLVIDRKDLDAMNGKRVLIVDDVISTGGSLHALEALVSRSTGTVVARAAVLAEGDAADRTDIVYLEKLPLFPH